MSNHIDRAYNWGFTDALRQAIRVATRCIDGDSQSDQGVTEVINKLKHELDVQLRYQRENDNEQN